MSNRKSRNSANERMKTQMYGNSTCCLIIIYHAKSKMKTSTVYNKYETIQQVIFRFNKLS